MLNPKDLRVNRVNGRSVTFLSPEVEVFYATKRVANEILYFQMNGGPVPEISIQEWRGQKWLATPSRF